MGRTERLPCFTNDPLVGCYLLSFCLNGFEETINRQTASHGYSSGQIIAIRLHWLATINDVSQMSDDELVAHGFTGSIRNAAVAQQNTLAIQYQGNDTRLHELGRPSTGRPSTLDRLQEKEY
jgi:hypothetical protein